MKKLFSIGYTDNAIAFATFILRIGIGGLLIRHGYSKLTHFANLASNFSDPFHIGHATSLTLVIIAEFFCAIFLVIGLFTRLSCIPIIVAMSVAVFSAHKGDIFGKGELPMLYLAATVALLFTGPGRFSLDRYIGK